MAIQIKWTESAKDDVREIRAYLQANQSPEYARKITQQIKNEVVSLLAHPSKGTHPAELEELELGNFRQLLAGQNRIIFQQKDNVFYIHLVCHTSRDLRSLLLRRLLT
ncbi:type II toxin-antitoxin system RelE/ParE family toxin [Pseudoduganella violacea]|uniref:Plasmid stabilization system protein ParE n=1 Tax=Pseudoduganella violacea TaxID=1715466 RepID=A0A7W5FTB5_9BURK|nr:type II toxin-antitoxin system RelE/ParE family toxin [Pseudoduganella violacea]MBB3118639.1 plasmid stabilization system protein ParE [Pseudoduganella violacea]